MIIDVIFTQETKKDTVPDYEIYKISSSQGTFLYLDHISMVFINSL